MPDIETENTAQASSLPPESLALLKSVREMLNEEKWTRAALSNYSTNQFKEFDSILSNARDRRVIDEMKKDCDDHLSHSRNSIIALYLSGMVALSRQIIDDAAMVNLVTIFADNNKWAIVKYLCERILNYGESKFALRKLIECYKNENNEAALPGIWERLVKVDYEEADIAKALAEHYEKQGKDEAAVDYYKKALHRYINKGMFASVKEIWEKLLLYCPDDIDFFLHVQKKVAKIISEEKAIDLLKIVYESCKKDNVNTAIDILKIVLQYDEKDNGARREIVECYRKKYAGHSQVEDYIRISNLLPSYRNVQEAITDFEKHISFDKGSYVFHRTWGVGRIAGIEGDDIRIDFSKKRDHVMSLKMAIEALQTLSKDHIWVLKATWKKEKFVEKIKADIPWALRTVIKSFGNSCDIKRIKAELCPGMLTEKEWTSWNTKARDVLKSDPNFGVSPDNIDIITIRERPISVSEKLYNEFKAERNFFDRAATIRSFANQENADIDSEYFAEMFSYLSSFVKTPSQAGEQTIAAYLLIKELAGKYPHLGASLPISFADIFTGISDIPGIYSSLKDNTLKKNFLASVQQYIPGWADVFVQMFPRNIDASIISQLEREGHYEKLTAMAVDCFDHFKERREAVVWLYRMNAAARADLAAKTGGEKESLAEAEARAKWYGDANISEERQLIALISILDLTYRDIDNQRDTAEARKINKQVHSILFKDKCLALFIDGAGLDTVTRFYTFISDVKNLDPQDKLNLKSRIMEKHPDFKFTEVSEKRLPQGLIVTKAKFEEKQKELAHIMDVEVPANSKELEAARQHGDLSENAEFKAATEKQGLLNSVAERLKGDLERAQIFDPAMIDTSRVSFGTVVVLYNNSKDRTEEYTILGPWESDPEHNIISYQTPFGREMLTKSEGEQFSFTSEGEKKTYTVQSIRAAGF
ncbi:MAG: transcription elongation factor GreA [Treponema sp.]|jgi:transcription elongation factor GreA|nr:transcription elongation factor GreA [Treponema sp.]